MPEVPETMTEEFRIAPKRRKDVIPEKLIEAHLVRRAKALGGIALKIPTMFARSWPDRLVLLPGKRIGFAELKSSIGKPTEGQLHVLGFLKGLGFPAEVINSKEGVEAFLGRI